MRRYPGAPPFGDSPADNALFFGRTDEVAGLAHRLVSSRLLVLYGMSGLGKTSLLRAGAFPLLRERELLPMYLSVRHESLAQLVAQIDEIAAALPGIDVVPGEHGTLWEYFKTTMFWRGDRLLTPVLVFDQFEEVFTLGGPERRAMLGAEIGSLVSGHMPQAARERQRSGESSLKDGPPAVKVVLSLREEYVGALQELAGAVPGLLQERFRLLPLSREAAAAAIEMPARLASVPGDPDAGFDSPPFGYEPATLERMLDFLEGESRTIESWQLQLLCQHVEDEVIALAAAGRTDIQVDASIVGSNDSMDSVLRNFYARTIDKVAPRMRRRARLLCEEGLLTLHGNRVPLSSSQIKHDYRLDDATLDVLEGERLLHREKRLGSVFYEISHDSLTRPLMESRPWRIPRRLRQGLWIAAPVVLVAVVAVMAALVGLNGARKDAQAQRDRAEDLVAFLIGEDWLDKLRAMGRMDVVNDVQDKVDQYVAESSKEDPRRAALVRNRAIAHRHRAQLLADSGKLSQAGAELIAAEGDLRQLRAADPGNDDLKVQLAATLAARSLAESRQGYIEPALRLAREAERLVGEVPGEKSRLVYSEALLSLASVLQDRDDDEDALPLYDRVVDLSDEMIHSGSMHPMWLYNQGIALGKRGSIKQSLSGDAVGEARADLRRSREIAEALVKQDPLNARYRHRFAGANIRMARFDLDKGEAPRAAQVADAFRLSSEELNTLVERDQSNRSLAADAAQTLGSVGEVEFASKQTAAAVGHLQQSVVKWEALVRLDPSNLDWQVMCGESNRFLARALEQADQPEAALRFHVVALRMTRSLMEQRPDHPVYAAQHSLNLDYVARLLESKPALRASFPAVAGPVVQSLLFRPVQSHDGVGLIDLHRAAVTASKKAVSLSPGNAYYRQILARAHYRVADALLGTSQQDEVLPALKESILEQTAATTLTRFPMRDAIVWKNLAVMHESAASVYQTQRDYRGALAHWYDSLATREKVLRIEPGDERSHDAVITVLYTIALLSMEQSRGTVPTSQLLRLAQKADGMKGSSDGQAWLDLIAEAMATRAPAGNGPA